MKYQYLLLAAEAPDSPAKQIGFLLGSMAFVAVNVLIGFLLTHPRSLSDNKRTGDWCSSSTGYCRCQREHCAEHHVNKRNLEYIREREAGSIDDEWCKSVTGHCRCKRMHFEEHEKNRIRIEYHLEPDAEIRS